jgi:hypothetical protein
MHPLLQLARHLLRGLLIALLPSPERDNLARQHGHDAPRWSFLLGLIQGPVGVALFMVGGLAFMRGASLIMSWGMLESWQTGMTTNDIRATGVIGWIGWFFNPLAWPPAYLAMVGLARCLTFAITREAMGEPLVIAAMRLTQVWSRKQRLRRREGELGPLRPDRIIHEHVDLVILSCREKPDWRPAVTIEIEKRFYRLLGVEERTDGPLRVLAYRLGLAPHGALVRRLVRYEPPAG